MPKKATSKNPITITFYCAPLERMLLSQATARTGMSLSGAIREAIVRFTQPLLDELRASAGRPPEGVSPEAWVLQYGERQVTTAEAARLRAKADELDAKAR